MEENNVTDEQIEFAKNTHQVVINWINNCDVKNGILFTLFGVLVSTIPFKYKDFLKLAEQGDGIDLIIPYMIGLTLLVSMIIYIHNALRVVYPKTTLDKNKFHNINSLIFFGSINNMKLDTLRTRYNNLDKEKILKEYLSQIRVNSIMCQSKFDSLKNSVISLIVFLLSYFILKVFLFKGN